MSFIRYVYKHHVDFLQNFKLVCFLFLFLSNIQFCAIMKLTSYKYEISSDESFVEHSGNILIKSITFVPKT
jgi:hypothetical protein